MIRPDFTLLRSALSCKCPRCHQGTMFKPGLSLGLTERCAACSLNLADNDCGDGAVVFLIFILGFILVPFALLIEMMFSPPLWAHAVITGTLALGFTMLATKPLKSYIIALQFKHRPNTWKT